MRVCVIGSGISGIAAVRELTTALPGAHITWLSADLTGGGLWSGSSSCSRVYDALFLNTSRRQSTFRGTDLPLEPWVEFVHHSAYSHYLARVAEECAPQERRWGCRVTEVSGPADGTWLVRWQDQRDGSVEAASFDAVVDATGRNVEPRWPRVPVAADLAYPYTHSSSYRNAWAFRDRAVLVVGNGASAVDIACDLADVASRVTVSARTPKWYLPKMLFGRPVDRSSDGWLDRVPGAGRVTAAVAEAVVRKVLGPYGAYGLPDPPLPLARSTPVLSDHFLAFLSHGRITVRAAVRALEPERVLFADGADAFDAVIAATGFRDDSGHLPGPVQERLRDGLGVALDVPGSAGLFLMNRFRCGDAAVRCAEVQAAAIARTLRGGVARTAGIAPVVPGKRITARVLRGAYAHL
ncbi:NAD(P)-binding domain-containing protein [Couchioplanes caeruleus]|uniref:flavin-containing monooxygenase n=1 Tax=Couchioplanes caeruleus TaxID=56438 RepID=UPI0020C0598E|nr:NAD(P)-binding domain-containing protein [Couchioplanes caeruleus]UQU63867.1 NAD(P)-binding domain-containing protein [Couchioplanes caeruleus]